MREITELDPPRRGWGQFSGALQAQEKTQEVGWPFPYTEGGGEEARTREENSKGGTICGDEKPDRKVDPEGETDFGWRSFIFSGGRLRMFAKFTSVPSLATNMSSSLARERMRERGRAALTARPRILELETL